MSILHVDSLRFVVLTDFTIPKHLPPIAIEAPDQEGMKEEDMDIGVRIRVQCYSTYVI